MQNNEIKTRPWPACPVCGSAGSPLYQGLNDRLFGAPGSWNLKKCTNPDCGLIWLDPMPREEDLGRLYDTYYTHETRESSSLAKQLYRCAISAYLSKRFGYPAREGHNALDHVLGVLLYLHPGARAEADARVMSLPAKPGGRLLEVGFGNGQTLRRMQSLGWSVQGVEFDPVAVNNARASGLNVYQGDLASQHFPESSFDAVVSSHVIEHLPDPEGFLNECRRVLKRDGSLVIYTPNSSSFGHRLFRRNWRGLEPPRHLHLFNAHNLPDMIRRSGFAEISCHTTARGGSILMASWYLSRNRRTGMPPAVSRLIEEAAHYVSWAACKFNPDLGEELVLIAHKAA